MQITREWLEQELFSSDFFDKDILNWFSEQEETDPIKLIKKLLQKDIQNNFDNIYNKNEQYSLALAFANWLLIRIMNSNQTLSYAIAAIEHILPFLQQDFPEEKTPRNLINLTKTYLQVITEMPLKVKIAYRNLLFSLLEFTGRNTDIHKQYCICWITYATHLVSYAALYADFRFMCTNKNFCANCATHAVIFSICYLPVKERRDNILKKIIMHGLMRLGVQAGLTGPLKSLQEEASQKELFINRN